MKQTPHQEGIANIKMATTMSFSLDSGLLFWKDKHDKLSFIVDSGATLSILPCSSEAAPLGPKFIGANGTSIPTGGFKKKPLVFKDKTFTRDFLRA
jgi:hypothetical protein